MRRAVAAGMLGLTAVAGLAAAPSAASARAQPEATFKLRGTHGYQVTVDGSTGSSTVVGSRAAKLGVPASRLPKTSGDSVSVSVSSAKSSATSYSVAGSVTARRLRARLGPFGRVYVRFHAERTRRLTLPRPCSGSIVERVGTFTGTIRFHGEDGYTRVDAATAPGKVLLPHGVHCPAGNSAGQGQEAGTAAIATSPTTYFAAFKGDSESNPVCLALAEANVGHVAILRLIVIRAGSGAFTFAPDLSSAHLDLPAPFAGVANFAAPHAWTGTLSASFPGAVDVPFAGPGYRARMKRF